MTSSINEMIAWRALQGFIGGGMIPTVFASAYLIFPSSKQSIIAPLIGLVATLAPTIGPTVGGYLTHALSWHWLFFINVVPGIVVTVAVLALQEQLLGRRYAGVAFLGDISYSTYLLHFPLQLAAVLLALHFGLSTGFFMNGAVMIAFFVVLIALATASHYWFERPLQNILRRAFRSRRGHSAASASALAESHLSSAAAMARTMSERSLARNAASIGRL